MRPMSPSRGDEARMLEFGQGQARVLVQFSGNKAWFALSIEDQVFPMSVFSVVQLHAELIRAVTSVNQFHGRAAKQVRKTSAQARDEFANAEKRQRELEKELNQAAKQAIAREEMRQRVKAEDQQRKAAKEKEARRMIARVLSGSEVLRGA